jgi:hypothetical protein
MALSRIRAALTIDRPVASVTISAPGSSTGLTVNSLTPSVTKVVPLAAVKWVLIQYSAEIDFRGLNPTPRDVFVVVDLAALSVGKNPSDAATAADELQPFVLGKGLTDNPQTAEQTSYGLTRSITDEPDVSEQAVYSFETSRTDSYVVADTTSLNPGKAFVEVINGQREGPNQTQNYAGVDYFAGDYVSSRGPALHVFKSASELLSHTDSETIIVGKNLTENKVTSETHTYALTRTINDTVDATDDFDGEASAEDDQTMTFITGRSDVISISDTSTQAVGKGLTESNSATETGALRMTDYCDVNYFAQDYVGTSLTF